MWNTKRDLSAEWNLRREKDWEWARARRAFWNAVLFLLFGLVGLAAAFANAWTKGEVPRNRPCADSGMCGGRGSHRF